MRVSSFVLAPLLAIALVIGLTPSALAQTPKIATRVNDAQGMAGNRIAIVLRTYEAQPLETGRVHLRIAPADAQAPALPFAAMEGHEVFSGAGDAVSDASMETIGDAQHIYVAFTSVSGTVNQAEGPLVVIYVRLRSDIPVDAEYRLRLLRAGTDATGIGGQTVILRPRHGELRVRGRRQRYEIEADGDRVSPGDTAEIGVQTFEPAPMSSGQVALLYDPAVTRGNFRVRLDQRYGRRDFTVDDSTPGRLLISFASPDGSWNGVPGRLVEILIRTRGDVEIGTRSPLTFDPALTFFLDPAGNELDFGLEDGDIEFARRSAPDDDDDGDDGDDDDGDDDGDDDDDGDGDDDGDEDDDGDDDDDDDGDDDGDEDDEDDDDS